jgi:broad specificity phosphatase PhoE
LSEFGHLQAESLSRRLAQEYQIDHIFSSPLSRAAETAVHLGYSVGASIRYDDKLKERGLGVLTGLDEAFQSRVEGALAAILAQIGVESTTAVVSHAGTLNKILQLCLSLPDSGPSTFSFKNTSLTVIDIYETFTRLILLNDTCHLTQLETLDAERTTSYSETHYQG